MTAFVMLMTPVLSWSAPMPIKVTDAAQRQLNFASKPQRVVSLVPYITEMLVRFGQEEVLVGLTRQDLTLNSGLRKKNVGGYFQPDIEAIIGCGPDLIVAAPSHQNVIDRFSHGRCNIMVMEVRRLDDAFAHMETIGRLFECESKAAEVIKLNRGQLSLVKARLSKVPMEKRKRVARIMAGDSFCCPGDDSFQNEMIAEAGGIVPKWGENGFAVPVDSKAWRRFNPQFVYGCHENKIAVMDFLSREDWKGVDAVKNGAISMFPCDLTCQASTRVGAFVQWLAAVLYLDVFADPQNAISDNSVLSKTSIPVKLPYVEAVQMVTHRVSDATFKTLAVSFKRPISVLSTLEGPRSNLRGVGNTYVPMYASLGHMAYGIEPVQKAIAENLGFDVGEYAGLMTGANMDNLSIQKMAYKDLEIKALVTAGVRGNALRMSKDTGGYMGHGTINIILLTNRKLSPGAMAGALISITEAKTAALLDLDIRSSYTPWGHRATGTGTDSIIVVQGEGPQVRYVGGHTKIGELIAKAVHAGVTEAVLKQNGIRRDRDVFQRLNERHLTLEQLLDYFPVNMDKKKLVSEVDALLADPYYASFIESALAVSDEYRKGLMEDLTIFDTLCESVVKKMTGRHDLPIDISTVELPEVMAKAFGVLIYGISQKYEQHGEQ